MAQDVYGTTLDSLMRNRIAEEDQDLRANTANQNYLAQLAGERTRGRQVDVQRELGLGDQSVRRELGLGDIGVRRELGLGDIGVRRELGLGDIGVRRELGLGDIGVRKRIAGMDAQARRDVAKIMGDTSISVAKRQARANERIAKYQKEMDAARNEVTYQDLEDRYNLATMPAPMDPATRMDLLKRGEEQARTSRLAAQRLYPTSSEYLPSYGGAIWETIKSFPSMPDLSVKPAETLETSKRILAQLGAEGVDTSLYQIDYNQDSPTFGKLIVAPPTIDYMAMARGGSPSPVRRTARPALGTGSSAGVTKGWDAKTGTWKPVSEISNGASGLWGLTGGPNANEYPEPRTAYDFRAEP